jgi:hypothetical protein
MIASGRLRLRIFCFPACIALLLAAALQASADDDKPAPEKTPPTNTSFRAGPETNPSSTATLSVDFRLWELDHYVGRLVFDPELSGATQKNSDNEPDKKDKANGDDKKDEGDKDKEENKVKLLPQGWNFHAQTTIIPNFQPGIGALYSGPNSLGPGTGREATITADLYLGVPLWQGAEFHADLLMWQGFGLNNSFGLEEFLDADAYKAGTVEPRFMFAFAKPSAWEGNRRTCPTAP